MFEEDKQALIDLLKEDTWETKEEIIEFIQDVVPTYSDRQYIPTKWLEGLQGKYFMLHPVPLANGKPHVLDVAREIVWKWKNACDLEEEMKGNEDNE